MEDQAKNNGNKDSKEDSKPPALPRNTLVRLVQNRISPNPDSTNHHVEDTCRKRSLNSSTTSPSKLARTISASESGNLRQIIEKANAIGNLCESQSRYSENKASISREASYLSTSKSSFIGVDLTDQSDTDTHHVLEYDENDLIKKEQEDLDLAIALSMQVEIKKQEEYEAALARAWNFVDKINANHRNLLQYDPDRPDMNANNFSPVAADDMVLLARRLYSMQEELRKQGKDTRVDIGYHYTNSKKLEDICTDGLLNRSERESETNNNNPSSRSNEALFGDGIYTANNPYSYYEFAGADQCLFVARLKGTSGVHNNNNENTGVNTVLGRPRRSDEVCVLKKSSQCIALVKFNSPLVDIFDDTSAGNDMVYQYHCSLQAIVDECFNKGLKVSVPKIMPSQVAIHSNKRCQVQTILYVAPKTLEGSGFSKELQPVDSKLFNNTDDVECSICLAVMTSGDTNPVCKIRKCGHYFHRNCIESGLASKPKCPLCRQWVGVGKGHMPTGTMTVSLDPSLHCDGIDDTIPTYVINYRFHGGTQCSYHVNPGQPYSGAERTAYVPATREGRELMTRLKFAFHHGMTFTIGTSSTTGEDNSIIWGLIDHKTSTSVTRNPDGSHAHSFPDPSYFWNVNEELNSLHVPSAHDCLHMYDTN